MRKTKSPQEKKQQSLIDDRRNMYGESPHSSRKNIPRAKQRQHQEERRTSNQLLAAVSANSNQELAVEREIQADTKAKLNRLKGFKKIADRSLSEFLGRQQARRQRQGMLSSS